MLPIILFSASFGFAVFALVAAILNRFTDRDVSTNVMICVFISAGLCNASGTFWDLWGGPAAQELLMFSPYFTVIVSVLVLILVQNPAGYDEESEDDDD